MKLGSGDNGEFTFLDTLAIVSFCVGLQNLDLNISAADLDSQTQELDRRLKSVIDDIHNHLSVQDSKLNIILNKLEALNDTHQESR